MSTDKKAIQHVWFDLNGTLALYTPEYSAAHDRLRYETYAELTGRKVDDELKAEYEQLYREHSSNAKVFKLLGQSDDFWIHRFNKLEDGFVYQAFPEIYGTLEKIKDIVPISIFTNNSRTGVSKVLREIQAPEQWFTHIITGDDVLERKPDLHGYKLAVEKSQLPASQLLYVGDRVGADIIPAKKVGMQTCLMYDKAPEADYCFEKFQDLLTLFK